MGAEVREAIRNPCYSPCSAFRIQPTVTRSHAIFAMIFFFSLFLFSFFFFFFYLGHNICRGAVLHREPARGKRLKQSTFPFASKRCSWTESTLAPPRSRHVNLTSTAAFTIFKGSSAGRLRGERFYAERSARTIETLRIVGTSLNELVL